MRELVAVFLRTSAGGKARQQFGQHNQRQMDFMRGPQRPHRPLFAAHEAAVSVGVDDQRAHGLPRRRRAESARAAGLPDRAQRPASISAKGATAASNEAASARDQAPARSSRSSNS